MSKLARGMQESALMAALQSGGGSEHALALVIAWLLLAAMPDHAGKAFERHQRLAGIGPFLQFLDRDVIERLPAGAIGEQRAGNVDHVRRARAFVNQGRAAAPAEGTRGSGRGVFEARDIVFA